jgi:hypothetical protein
VELEWLKKDEIRALPEAEYPQLNIRRQSALLGFNRASNYYVDASEDQLDLDAYLTLTHSH